MAHLTSPQHCQTRVASGRPEYFTFFEAQLSQEYPNQPLEPKLPYAERLARECCPAEEPKQVDPVVEASQSTKAA